MFFVLVYYYYLILLPVGRTKWGKRDLLLLSIAVGVIAGCGVTCATVG